MIAREGTGRPASDEGTRKYENRIIKSGNAKVNAVIYVEEHPFYLTVGTGQ
jgi:hypothetical protein